MVRKSVPALAALLLIVLSLSGCSHYTAWQYGRAKKLEAQGKAAQALASYLAAVRSIPDDNGKWRSDAWTHIGECYWRTDRASEAFAAYDRAALYDPTNIAAQLRLGEIFLASGAPERAGEKARFVLTTHPENPEALALLGSAAAAGGNSPLAELAYERALEVDPNKTHVSVAYANLLNQDDKVTEARAVLNKAIQLNAKSAEPWLALGRLEEQEGNAETAEDAYRKAVAIADTPETNLRLAQFLERGSQMEESRRLLRHVDGMRQMLPTALGDTELSSGRPESALEDYLNGLRLPGLQKSRLKNMQLYLSALDPRSRKVGRDAALSRAALAARTIEADLQIALQQRDGSAPASTAAARLRLDQYRNELDSATIDVLEAEIALAENDLSNAAVRANGALAIAPNSAAARYVSGLVKYHSGERGAALEEWVEALKHDTNFVPARLALASHELRFGNPQSAEDYVVQAVRDEPANLPALLLYARVLTAEKQYDSAELIAKRAQAVDKKSAEPHMLLGDLALARKNYAAALAELEQAVLLEPRNERAIEALTRVYNSGVVTRPLLQRFELIANSDPPSATLMEVAGRLYAERSWYDDARRCFQRSLELDSTRQSAKLALAQLDARAGNQPVEFASLNKLEGSGALLSAMAAENRNDIVAAIKQYEVAVREGERDGVAANNLAWLLAQKGDLDRALTYASRAYHVAGHDPAVLDTLGFIYLKRREYTAAVVMLQDAQRIASKGKADPERPGLAEAIRDHLWEAYLRSGDTNAAAMLASKAMVQSSTPEASRSGIDPQIEHPTLTPVRRKQSN